MFSLSHFISTGETLMPIEIFDTYYDVREIAKELDIHPESVRRLIRQGHLKAIKFGAKLLISSETFLSFRSTYMSQKTWKFKDTPILPPGMISVLDAARRENTSPSTIRRWIREGKIKADKQNGFRWLIHEESLASHPPEFQCPHPDCRS
jgi:excisionase family DNA binding protein